MVVERGAFYVADPVNLKASFTYPATSLLAFLFQPFGLWAEWACLAAIDTLALACLAAAAALPRLKWAEGILVFAAGFLLPYFFSATAAGNYAVQYVNAMADLPLAMLFGGTLCLYFAVGRHKHAYWLVALPLAVLTLTKDICFAYGLIAAFLIGLDLLLAADAPIKKTFPKALLQAGALAVVVLAAFLSWGRYTAVVTPTADTAASVGSEGLSYGAVLIGGVKQLLGIGRTEKFAQIMTAMGSAFFTRRICPLGGAAAVILAVFCWRGIPAAGFWTGADSLYTLRADVQSRASTMNTVLDWPDRVLVISQGDDATRWYYYRYELTAQVVNGFGGFYGRLGETKDRWDSDFMNLVESENWTLYDYKAVCVPDTLVAYMAEKDCDYILIDRADDYLQREFSPLFEGGLTNDMPATLYHFEGVDAAVPFTLAAVAESGVA